MSELSIFSLLVVGRDLPSASISKSGLDYRPVDRVIPIAKQREALQAKRADAEDSISQARGRILS